ncbi:MAG: ABC transporter substrate-binding protein, partial [Acidimicrobiales bacterium]
GHAGAAGSTAGGHGATAAPAPPAAAHVASCGGHQVPGDPYSPPCRTFSGSNGGATSKGVTATTINVAYRNTNDKGFQQELAALGGANLADSPADIQRTISALITYFNNHYQFYGRKLALSFYNGQGLLANELLNQGQAAAEADAVTVGQQMKSFADLSAQSQPYAEDLAAQGVLAFGDPYMSQNWHRLHAPYTWSIAVDGTTVADLASNYAVKKLCPAGTPATYAGGQLKNVPRKFAALAPENKEYQDSVVSARNVLSSHGCDPGVNQTYQLDLGTISNQASNIIAKFKSSGVTTILCGCDPITPVFLSGDAAQQGYFPEFIIVGTALTDADLVGQLWNQQFTAHALGISPNAPTVPSTQTLGYAAYKTVRSDEPAFTVDLIFQQIEEMAIGITLAGPNLTPNSFEQGMFSFPPQEGPYGLWGFGPNDFTTTDDVREICWSPTAISAYNQKQGAYLPGKYNNARWVAGTIPPGPPGCPIPSS